MNKNKILHIMVIDKFLAPFIEFVDKHFGREGHHYVFISSEKYEFGLSPEHKIEFLHTDNDIFITLYEYMKMAKKIILHGLWSDKVDVLLYFNKKLLKKCYWVMWGGDFYFPETKSKIRHEIIKNMGYFITYIKEDYYLAKNWYCNTDGKYIASFTYPSNLYKYTKLKTKKTRTINILVGNSATETNQHIDIFEKLLQFKDENLVIYAPLSYGDKNYAMKIAEKGEKLFGNKFIPLLKFMDFNTYIKLLSNIDIAIFNHNRQQAIGNTITFLSLSKKVYLNSGTIQYNFFKNHNIEVFDIDNIDLAILDKKTAQQNKEKIKLLFSKKVLKDSLKKIFNE